ncbi:MAG: riboflavin biosynthesis protein RibF [bacterium]|nr:riboflavin biosynthesis protein RibF [bacterium]
MEIINNNTKEIKDASLILGFFDGIHLGHKNVIEKAVSVAKETNSKTVLLTFKNSPAEFFNKEFSYICPREISYKKIETLGVDYIYETEFETLAEISAEDYLESIVSIYHPQFITTGYNYTFGKNKKGTTKTLEENQEKYDYKYFCTPEYKFEKDSVSSTEIKKLLKIGNIEKANEFLGSPFSLTSKVIEGAKLGRKLGFPTANMIYPKNIIKIPYGVYLVETLGRKGMLNWGIKPTVNGSSEILETNIFDFSDDIYGKDLEIKILKKIRDEKKFSSLEELKNQIEKDKEYCLKS